MYQIKKASVIGAGTMGLGIFGLSSSSLGVPEMQALRTGLLGKLIINKFHW